eukprot:1155343-Pelagomonas_calceolata.AAC.2
MSFSPWYHVIRCTAPSASWGSLTNLSTTLLLHRQMNEGGMFWLFWYSMHHSFSIDLGDAPGCMHVLGKLQAVHLRNPPSLLSHYPPPPSTQCPAAASPLPQRSGRCPAMLHTETAAAAAAAAAAAGAGAAAAPAPPHSPQCPQALLLLLALLTCFSTNCSHTQAFFLPFLFSPFLGSPMLRLVGGVGASGSSGLARLNPPGHSLHVWYLHDARK